MSRLSLQANCGVHATDAVQPKIFAEETENLLNWNLRIVWFIKIFHFSLLLRVVVVVSMRLAIHGQIWIRNYEQNELNHVEFESQLFTCLNIYEIRIRTECGDMNRVNTLAHWGAAATARGCYSQISLRHTHTRNVSVFIDCCCIRVARVTCGHVKRLQIYLMWSAWRAQNSVLFDVYFAVMS